MAASRLSQLLVFLYYEFRIESKIQKILNYAIWILNLEFMNCELWIVNRESLNINHELNSWTANPPPSSL